MSRLITRHRAHAHEQGGEQALREISRRKPIFKNRVEEYIERTVTEIAVENLVLSQLRASNGNYAKWAAITFYIV